MAIPCHYCDAQLTFIRTKNKKAMPCIDGVVIRHGSEPPPKGVYIDQYGEIYPTAEEVPCKVKVWLIHFGNCPGYEKKRRV